GVPAVGRAGEPGEGVPGPGLLPAGGPGRRGAGQVGPDRPAEITLSQAHGRPSVGVPRARAMPLSPLILLALALPLRADDPALVGPMKEVHSRFERTPGTLAAFGDSITVTMALWAPLQGEPRNMPDDMKAA